MTTQPLIVVGVILAFAAVVGVVAALRRAVDRFEQEMRDMNDGE